MATKNIKLLNSDDLATVNESDYEWASQYEWHKNKNGYAYRKDGNLNILMHYEVVFRNWNKFTKNNNVDPLLRFEDLFGKLGTQKK